MLNFSLYKYTMDGYDAYLSRHSNKLTYLYPQSYSTASRYQNILCIEDSLAVKYHETYPQFKIEKSDQDIYYKVESANENRLDIISNIAYNTPKFWWVIAMANDIVDPFKVPVDTILRIPDLSVLYNEVM